MTRRNPTPSDTRALSTRQERFAREYTLDHDAPAAYLRAGYTATTARTAEGNSARLLRDERVRAAIAAHEAEAARRAGLDTAAVLRVLWREANGNGPDTSSAARVRAAELIGKHLGMWDRPEAPTPSPGTVTVSATLTPADVAAAMRFLGQEPPPELLLTAPADPPREVSAEPPADAPPLPPSGSPGPR